MGATIIKRGQRVNITIQQRQLPTGVFHWDLACHPTHRVNIIITPHRPLEFILVVVPIRGPHRTRHTTRVLPLHVNYIPQRQKQLDTQHHPTHHRHQKTANNKSRQLPIRMVMLRLWQPQRSRTFGSQRPRQQIANQIRLSVLPHAPPKARGLVAMVASLVEIPHQVLATMDPRGPSRPPGTPAISTRPRVNRWQPNSINSPPPTIPSTPGWL